MTNNPSPDKVPAPPPDDKPVVASPAVNSTPEKPTAANADQPMTDSEKTLPLKPNLPTGVPVEPVSATQASSPAPDAPAAPAKAAEQKDPVKQAKEETIPHKSPTDVEKLKGTETPITIPPLAQALPDIENPYVLAGEVDRARLIAQGKLFTAYIETHAKEFVGENLKRILDVGCAEGRITQVFARLYPDAEVIGIDKDENSIEEARRAAYGRPNLKFEVRDITQGLPPGPFDLVYESLVFQHLQKMPPVIKAAYEVLKPGGYLWMKDLDIHYDLDIDHPAYKRLTGWGVSMMDMAGLDWRIAANLAPVLSAAGLNLLRQEKEFYPMGNMNTNARLSMAVNLGAMYNSRKAMSRFLKVPESDIVSTYKEIVDALMAPGGPSGDFKYMNTISQRPADSAPATATDAPKPSNIPPSSDGGSLPIKGA